MCSKCYKQAQESLKELESPAAAVLPAAAAVASVAAAATSAPNAQAAAPEKRMKTQEDKSRCWECKKRVGLTGIECRCGYIFCGGHRYADAHACQFDFKTFDRASLAKANQKVVAESVEKL